MVSQFIEKYFTVTTKFFSISNLLIPSLLSVVHTWKMSIKQGTYQFIFISTWFALCSIFVTDVLNWTSSSCCEGYFSKNTSPTNFILDLWRCIRDVKWIDVSSRVLSIQYHLVPRIFSLFCVPDIIMKTNSLSNSIIIMALKGFILNETESVDPLVQGVFGLFTFLYSHL